MHQITPQTTHTQVIFVVSEATWKAGATWLSSALSNLPQQVAVEMQLSHPNASVSAANKQDIRRIPHKLHTRSSKLTSSPLCVWNLCWSVLLTLAVELQKQHTDVAPSQRKRVCPAQIRPLHIPPLLLPGRLFVVIRSIVACIAQAPHWPQQKGKAGSCLEVVT
jgi:hypothetical protein